MPWPVLLFIALLSLVIVLVMLARTGLQTWHVAKHGDEISRRVAPLVSGLQRRSDEITALTQQLSHNAVDLQNNVAAIQRSLARLQVVFQALAEALLPYQRLKDYLGR